MDAYLGHIIPFAANYAPENWLPCDGRSLKIDDYQALYVLLGKTYGGDNVTYFNLPDLRGRVPIGTGAATAETSEWALGEVVGEQTVTLTQAQMPAHTHAMQASTKPATTNAPGSHLLAKVPDGNVFYIDPPNPVPADITIDTVSLAPSAVQMAGSGQSHDNMMPSLAVGYIICVYGLFPEPV
jgi:microcystin-dependent protein